MKQKKVICHPIRLFIWKAKALNSPQNGGLRIESSKNYSGELFLYSKIPVLKEQDYIVNDYELDGDAPKQFITAYIFKENSTVRKKSPGSWASYIAKTAEKWYPHESVIEFMINRIGQVLGLHMNEIELVKANGQIRFLSKYFLNENEKLIHGAEICGEHLGDMVFAKEIANDKRNSRELFTFEFIKDSIRNVFPQAFENLILELVKMIVFDALVGNNDRHFYNWGVIDTKKKTTKSPTFAPIYDSARGLLWNSSDEDIKKMKGIDRRDGRKIVNYVKGASPRISIEENKQATHFELIDFIKRYNTEYKQIADDLSKEENEKNVLRMLRKEFFPVFIPERAEAITEILKRRFSKIRDNKYDAQNHELV